MYKLCNNISNMSCNVKRKSKGRFYSLIYISCESQILHKPSGHGYSSKGAMKLSLLGLYHKDPSRPLYSYVNNLYAFSGGGSKHNNFFRWFHNSFNFKATCTKPVIFPEKKIHRKIHENEGVHKFGQSFWP